MPSLGISQASAAKTAASDQEAAANKATAAELSMFNTTQANLKPYMTAGVNSLSDLLSGLGLGTGGTGTGPLDAAFNGQNLSQTPGYQFQFGQGEQSLLDATSATGGVKGGNTLKALTAYGQGMGNTEYQQALSNYMAQQSQTYDMLSGVATTGENAAANLGSTGTQVASQIGSNDIGAGNAAAAGTVGAANAIGGGISNLGSNFLLASILGSGGGGLGAATGGIGALGALGIAL